MKDKILIPKGAELALQGQKIIHARWITKNGKIKTISFKKKKKTNKTPR